MMSYQSTMQLRMGTCAPTWAAGRTKCVHAVLARHAPSTSCRASPVSTSAGGSGSASTSTSCSKQLLGVAASVLAACMLSSPAAALELETVEPNFAMKCAGCHAGGGNVLAVGASLFPDDLKRNGYDEPQALYELIYKGKGKMPGYGKDCAPKGQCTFGPRLTDEQVRDLASYVLLKAEAGWPK